MAASSRVGDRPFMSLLFFLLIIFSFYTQNFKQVFLLAFFAGLMSDLVFGNLVGFSSFCFLLVCFLIFLYRRKFSSTHLLFQLSFVIFSDWLFTLLTRGVWSFKKSLILVFASLIVVLLINRIKGRASGLELEV